MKKHNFTPILIFCILCVFGLANRLNAQSLILTEETEEISAEPYLVSFKDEGARLELTDILKAENQARFVGNENQIINYNLGSEAAVWVKLNLSLQTDKKFVIEVTNSRLSEVKLFGITTLR